MTAPQRKRGVPTLDLTPPLVQPFAKNASLKINDGADCLLGSDFGDAPDSYKTKDNSGGAAHVMSVVKDPQAKFYIGDSVDSDIDGFPSTSADTDDKNIPSASDEDRIPAGSGLDGDNPIATVKVTGSNYTLAGWLDTNHNGTFDDAELATSTSDTPTWPAATKTGKTHLRLRLYPNPNKRAAPTPGGWVTGGEIEDHIVYLWPQDSIISPRSATPGGNGPPAPPEPPNGPHLMLSGALLAFGTLILGLSVLAHELAETRLDASAHLLTSPGPDRYALHDLLRAYAAELGGTSPEAAGRMFDHYLHSARAAHLAEAYQDAVTLATPRDGVLVERPDDPIEWLTIERPVLLALLDYAAAHGLHATTWQLAGVLVDFFDRRGHWLDQAATQQVALHAAQQLGDERRQASAHRDLARAHARIGSYDVASVHLGHALDMFITLGDIPGQAHSHLALAWVLERCADLPGALLHARRAHAAFINAHDSIGRARALNAIGWYSALLGMPEQALAFCLRAQVLHEAAGERRGQAATWDSLGYLHRLLGNHAESISFYLRALDAYREFADRPNECEVLSHLGDTYEAFGNVVAAQTAREQAAEISDELGIE